MGRDRVGGEGGWGGVGEDDERLEYEFEDRVAGGEWLCEEDVVDYLVEEWGREMREVEVWGWGWRGGGDGRVKVGGLGGMKMEGRWLGGDKRGLDMVERVLERCVELGEMEGFEEDLVVDIVVDDGDVGGVVGMKMMEGRVVEMGGKGVVMGSGGGGGVYG